MAVKLTKSKKLRLLAPGLKLPTEMELTGWVSVVDANPESPVADAMAKRLIADFCLRHYLGLKQSPVVTAWVAEGLEALVAHKSVTEAFSLQRRARHRPKAQGHEFDVALWVALAERRGVSRPRAIEKVADLWPMEVRHVHRLLRKTSISQINFTADWDAYFFAIGKPLTV